MHIPKITVIPDILIAASNYQLRNWIHLKQCGEYLLQINNLSNCMRHGISKHKLKILILMPIQIQIPKQIMAIVIVIVIVIVLIISPIF